MAKMPIKNKSEARAFLDKPSSEGSEGSDVSTSEGEKIETSEAPIEKCVQPVQESFAGVNLSEVPRKLHKFL